MLVGSILAGLALQAGEGGNQPCGWRVGTAGPVLWGYDRFGSKGSQKPWEGWPGCCEVGGLRPGEGRGEVQCAQESPPYHWVPACTLLSVLAVSFMWTREAPHE